MLLVRSLYSVSNRKINEHEAVGGMRIAEGAENLP
jgi:hypothetical protein